MSKQEIIDARNSELEGAFVDMLNLVRQSAAQVNAISRLMLLSMESPEAYRFPEDYAAACEAMLCIGQDLISCAEGLAESVGIKIRDTAADRRLAARLAAEDDTE